MTEFLELFSFIILIFVLSSFLRGQKPSRVYCRCSNDDKLICKLLKSDPCTNHRLCLTGRTLQTATFFRFHGHFCHVKSKQFLSTLSLSLLKASLSDCHYCFILFHGAGERTQTHLSVSQAAQQVSLSSCHLQRPTFIKLCVRENERERFTLALCFLSDK